MVAIHLYILYLNLVKLHSLYFSQCHIVRFYIAGLEKYVFFKLKKWAPAIFLTIRESLSLNIFCRQLFASKSANYC
jgi:hypothetical protein